jgi:hypothetical protein
MKTRMTKAEKKQMELEGEEAYRERMIALMNEEIARVGYENIRRDTPQFRFIYDNMNGAKIQCPYCKDEVELGRRCETCKGAALLGRRPSDVVMGAEPSSTRAVEGALW